MNSIKDKIIDLGFTDADADDMLAIVISELAAKDAEIDILQINVGNLLDSNKQAEDENEKLRMLLWLRHGCSALYGDDGEMQCSHCMIDFKRESADSMEQKWYIAGYRKLANKALK